MLSYQGVDSRRTKEEEIERKRKARRAWAQLLSNSNNEDNKQPIFLGGF